VFLLAFLFVFLFSFVFLFLFLSDSVSKKNCLNYVSSSITIFVWRQFGLLEEFWGFRV